MIPEPLLEAISSGRCLLFIGAGFSKNAVLSNNKSMPDWNQLVNELKKQLQIDEADPIQIASEYEKKFGRTELIEKISSLLHVDIANPGPVHKKLTQILNFDTIFTTNFEHILERSYDEARIPYRTIIGDEQVGFYSPRTHVNIFKIHGDLSHIQNMVITKDDYDEFLEKYPVISTNLSSMFSTRTPLFIGYSLRDPHLRQIRRVLQSHLRKYQRKSYVVLFDVSKEVIKEYEKENFYVINLKTNGKTKEQSLLDFFCKIIDFVNIKSVNVQVAIPKEVDKTLVDEKKEASSNESEMYVGKIIKSFGELEIELRNILEKFGLEQQEVKKPLNSLISNGIKIGILSPSDVPSINRAREIRNMTAHSIKQPSLQEVGFVEDITQTIINKIKSQTIIPKRNVQMQLFLDKTTVTEEDTVKIVGKISERLENILVSISIVNPSGNLVLISQVPVNQRNEFAFSFVAGGPLWDQRGNYTIKAIYGSALNVVSTAFTFKKKLDFTTVSNPDIYELTNISGKTVDIPFVIKGGSLISIKPDYQARSLILSVEAPAYGEIWIKLSKTIINNKIYNSEDDFVILIDGEQNNFLKKSTFGDYELIIEFPKGAEKIEIIGRQLFGTSEEISENKNFVSILSGSSAPKEDEKYLKPQTIIINAGETITWVNEDAAAHTITSGTPEKGSDGIFDSSLFMSGFDFSYTFLKKGTYRYYCKVHPWKEGKIIVK